MASRESGERTERLGIRNSEFHEMGSWRTLWSEADVHSHGAFVPLNATVYNVALQGAVATYLPIDYSQVPGLYDRLDALRSEVSELRAEISQLIDRFQDQAATKTIAIHGLASKKYTLRKPLFATLEDHTDEVVARLPEFDLYASGENEAEALAALQKEIVELYEDLLASEAELGELPASWLRDLGDHLEERPQENG